MFKATPKKAGDVMYGESYGAYGFSFATTNEGPREPGPKTTTMSLRRVVPTGRWDPEIQMAVDITQRYRSGANSRTVTGYLTLRGEALREFCRRVLELEP